MYPLQIDSPQRTVINEAKGLKNHRRFALKLRWAGVKMFHYCLAAVALLAIADPVFAQVGADLNISPKRVVFGAGELSATIYVFNQGDQPATYSVELIDRVMMADCHIVAAADRAETTLDSARNLVQYTPRRITLQPRESRVIRVRARPGREGEHRSHLTVTALPPEPREIVMRWVFET